MVVGEVERTKYFTCHFSGEVGNLKLVIYYARNTNVDISSIAINTPVPYEINWIRLSIVFSVIFAIYLLFSLKVLGEPYSKRNNMHVFILQVFILLFVAIVMVYEIQGQGKGIVQFSKQIQDPYTGLMVDALEKGQVHLDYEASEELKSMENPYDYTARAKEKIDYLYDFAYYEGNYYVYFSVLPILTLFLPFKLLTGYYFPIELACLIYAIIGVIYTSLLTKEVLVRCFPNISIRKIILGILFMLFSSFLLFNIALSRIYELVSILGFALVMAGCYYFITTWQEKKVHYGRLVLSCTLLALAVSARPNLIFVSLLIVPTLLKKLWQYKKKQEYRQIIKLIFSVAIPYAIVGSLIMFYNYIRFDSILEFGAQYQLTSNDMGKLGYRISTIPIGLWHYLWNPFQIEATFPFIHPIDSTPLYVGFYGSGCKGVGVFALNKLMYLLFLLPCFRKKMKEENKLVWNSILTLLTIGILMVIVITIMAASYGRYSLDFVWMLSLATLLFVFWLGDKLKEHEFANKLYTIIIGILFICSFTWNALLSISSEKPAFRMRNTVEYYKVQSSICFWE